MKIVSASKNLQIVALWDERLNDVVHLLRLLRLTSAHAEDDIAVDAAFDSVAEIALVADEAGLFGMLKIVAVALIDLTIDGLLDPYDFVDKSKFKTKG